MTPIEITFTIDPASYLRLMRKVAFRKRYAILGISIGAFLIIMFVRQTETPDPWYVWVLPPVVYIGLTWSMLTMSIKRTFGFSTQLHQPLRYVFGAEGVGVHAEAGSSSYEWNQFVRVLEIPEWFLLYQNQATFNPVPKSAFSAEQLDQFRGLLASKGL